MSTRASVFKHPIHPMLIVFPLGLWTFSLICQIIALLLGHEVWGTVAIYTLGGGIVGAIAAAVPGFLDLFSVLNSKIAKLIIYHMSLNIAAFVAFTISFGMYLQEPGSFSAFIVSVIGFVLLIAGSWLGWELVYVRGMGISRKSESQSG